MLFLAPILHRGLRNDLFFNFNLLFPIFIWTFISIFYLDFYTPSLSTWTFISVYSWTFFSFSIWNFIPLFYFDFYFSFLFWLFSSFSILTISLISYNRHSSTFPRTLRDIWSVLQMSLPLKIHSAKRNKLFLHTWVTKKVSYYLSYQIEVIWGPALTCNTSWFICGIWR